MTSLNIIGSNPEASPGQYSPLIVIQRGAANQNPLFCIPGAGANVTSFCDLARALGDGVPIYGLQPRGYDGNLEPYQDVFSAAKAYIHAIQEVVPNGPYLLLGHSFGGWVALEIARLLTNSGGKVASLILVDTEAPTQEKSPHLPYTRVETLLKLVELFELRINNPLGLTASEFNGADHSQQVRLLLNRLVEVNLFSRQVSVDAIATMIHVFERDINTTYMPTSVYLNPLHLILSSESTTKSPDAFTQTDLLLWREYAPRVTYCFSAGNHVTMLMSPWVSDLASKIQRYWLEIGE